MIWKMILPMEIAKPLLRFTSHREDRSEAEKGNTGPNYYIHVNCNAEGEPPAKKRKEKDPGMLCLTPYVWQSTGLVATGIDATATMEDIGQKKYEKPWWYRSFHESVC